MNGPFFIGIDVGTQGARAVLMDCKGIMIGSEGEEFLLTENSLEEQSPYDWWKACSTSIHKLINKAKEQINPDEIVAIAVTSTSGTVIPLDSNNTPLHAALMYSDKRSIKEGTLCKDAAEKYQRKGFTGFNSSCGLSKMVWFARAFPQKMKLLYKWIHAADFITGKLCNQWGVTDYSNALKSGYDVEQQLWPDYIEDVMGVHKQWLPDVVPSGTPIATIAPDIAKFFGLSEAVQIVAGMTDGCASQLASGAVKPGDWNTTIGTTLVIKGVTKLPIKDSEDRLYNHRHPDGYWMPGGASNIGADWITKEFKSELAQYNEEAATLIPTGKIAYPLRSAGERFPFNAPHAKGFDPSHISSRSELFTAYLEGVAYVERYAYEMIETLSAEKVMAVYTAGGGSNSDVWLTIRSNVMNRPVYKMKHGSGAAGAAILAASKTYFSSVTEAVKLMTQIENEIFPKEALAEKYDEYYLKFLAVMKAKGYILNEQYA